MKKLFTKKTVIAAVLFLGIIISACALNVYYAQSISVSNTLKGYSSVDRAIDFQASNMQSADYACVSEFLKNYSDKLEFYSVMSTELEDIDIIGITSDTSKIGIEIGEWITDSNQIVVPYKIDGKYINPGDTYNLNGKDYTVCGVYSMSGYAADLYSSKRISASDYAAAGVSGGIVVDEDNPYDFSDRTAYGVFITYQDFVENGYKGDVLRVKFSSSFSDAYSDDFSDDFISYITNSTGNVISLETTAMDKAGEIYGVQFISKFLVYIMISLLSLINTLSIFGYVLKQNKKDFLIYKSLGATQLKLLIATAIETVAYIIIAYSIGFGLSKVIVNNTDLKNTVPFYGIKQYLLLISAVLGVALVYIIIKLCLTLKEDRNGEPVLSLGTFIKRTRLKGLYLLLKNYSSGILSEAVILLQVMLVAFSFTYVASFYFERGSNVRLAEKMTKGNETYVYAWNEKLLFEIMPNYGVETPTAEEAQNTINSLDGLNGFGSINRCAFHIDTDLLLKLEDKFIMPMYDLQVVSPSIIDDINIKVSKGVWLDEWENGVDIAEVGYIPVVVSSNFADNFNLKIGDTLCKNGFWFNRMNWEYVEDEKNEYWDLSNDTELFDIKIVGILKDNSNFLLAQGNPPTVNTIFSSVEDYIAEDQCIIYCPYLYKNGEMLCKEGVYDGQTLLFPDGSRDIEYYREQMEPYGFVYKIEDLAYRDDDYYLTGTSEYSVHLYITAALLFIGVAGYNLLSVERNKKTYGIYYSCGMPWKKSLSIAVKSNSVIFLLGGIIGTIFGIISANSTRTMAYDTIAYSALTSLGFILILFALSTVSIFAQISKLTPISLIRKGN